ncbi:MAG: hypothetical protein HC906_12795, partial [Bacteroidales bacterium]|nr:hypothetical protein [Bacteroidales bacterium]
MKKTKLVLHSILSILFLINLAIQAQIEEITEKFLYGNYNSATNPFKYRLFVPENYDSTKNYPIVLTLHGAGETGNDNEIQISLNHIATCWADSAFQSKHPCFIFSPQTPVYGWGYASVMEMLDSLVNSYSIDTNRIYITGLSMGGYGTW